MKIITFEDIINMNIEPLNCYEWASEIIKNKSSTILPSKVSLSDQKGMFMNTMPCIINKKWGGVKVVNRYPDRIPALDSKILLIDNSTGDFVSLVDANWITTMRTGAVAAHSIKLFSKKNMRTIAILGLGNTARATMLVLANLYKDREIEVKLLKYKNQAEQFVERFVNFKNLHFSVIEDIYSLIKGSDVIISCATYFAEDIASPDLFDEGCLVIPVHTRGFTNCDIAFDKVYADDLSHVSHFRNHGKYKFFAEVTDVVNNIAEGRIDDTERIIVYNVGIAIHDITFAAHIYDMAKDYCLDVDMSEPKEKFYI